MSRRVTIMGLGRHGGGVGVSRYLARRGALITVSDLATADALRDSLDHLSDLPNVQIHVGGHRKEDFAAAEMIVVNPAVRPGHPLLQLAAQSGAQLTSEIEIFLDACPASVIGVTGSSGKSTTASMIAAAIEQGGRRCWLGGNIGGSLLDHLPDIAPTDWVVFELSSFQLARLNVGVQMPSIAAITNCSPNHLDWHPTYDDYRAAKQRLIREQTSADVAVLSTDDSEVAAWRSLAKGESIAPWTDAAIPQLNVPGDHNRQNARIAAQVAELAGIDRQSIIVALRAFRGLRHRLEYVDDRYGRIYWNDSKSTTPSATIAALKAMTSPTWLLAGGISKGTDFSGLAKIASQLTQGVALFGRDRKQLFDTLSQAGCQNLHRTDDLTSAFAWCIRSSRPGDNILLSPACASLDQFQDYAERGRLFCSLVSGISSAERQPAIHPQ